MSEEAKLFLSIVKFFGIILGILTLAWAAGLGVAVSYWGNLSEGPAIGVGWSLVVTGILIVVGWFALCVSTYTKVDHFTMGAKVTKKEYSKADTEDTSG